MEMPPVVNSFQHIWLCDTCEASESPLGKGTCHPLAYFTEEVNPILAKLPLNFNGGLAKLGLTSLVKSSIDGDAGL